MGDKILMSVITQRRFRVLQGLLFVLCLVSLRSYASPHPAIGSSALVNPAYGIFFRPQGFALNAGVSGWSLGDSMELLTFSSPKTPTGSLSVRAEELRSELTLENYAKRWMKDYPSYGFDVLGTKTFAQGNARGLVIDLTHKKRNQQLRQILFLKDKKAVILTCKDDLKTFEATLAGCNQIAKTFEWVTTQKTQ